MKLSVAVAGENALPSAFVVFRGIEKSIRKAGGLGFHGKIRLLFRGDQGSKLTAPEILGILRRLKAWVQPAFSLSADGLSWKCPMVNTYSPVSLMRKSQAW